MSLHDWLTNTSRRVHRDGFAAVSESVNLAYNGAWRILGSRLPVGTNVFEREWDLLVLLDGCRVDALASAAEERSWMADLDIGRLRSVGSTSREWLAKTFAPAYREAVGSTAYVTANPYTEEILGPGQSARNQSPFNPANWPVLTKGEFLRVADVWRTGWDVELGTTPPRPVTDWAISIAREHEPGRLIVHYMQPHQPFVGERARATGNVWREENCWAALRSGEADVDRVREAYRENLGVVLDDVDLLLRNVEADVAVISSDHGNAFGEWGIYGHPNGFLHPCVKAVPWVETSAADERTHHPDGGEREPEGDVQEQLEALGYR